MRNPEAMIDLILTTAREDERIRAVVLNGSRANPNARVDRLQDFDIQYIVDSIEPFVEDPTWPDRFGPTVIRQLPEDMGDPPPSRDGTYAYLLLFTDGNRIDLTLCPWSLYATRRPDSLTRVLLDKDGRLGAVPPPSEADYSVQVPTAKAYADCCNEILWVSTYVAKGLWRNEPVYARTMAESYVRPQLMRLVDWYLAQRGGFAINPGKSGKRYAELLPPDLWALYARTYADLDLAQGWEALRALHTLFCQVAQELAQALGFDFPRAEAEAVGAYLASLEGLPRETPDPTTG